MADGDHLNAAAISTLEPAVVALLEGRLADDVDTLTRLRSQLSMVVVVLLEGRLADDVDTLTRLRFSGGEATPTQPLNQL